MPTILPHEASGAWKIPLETVLQLLHVMLEAGQSLCMIHIVAVNVSEVEHGANAEYGCAFLRARGRLNSLLSRWQPFVVILPYPHVGFGPTVAAGCSFSEHLIRALPRFFECSRHLAAFGRSLQFNVLISPRSKAGPNKQGTRNQ